MSSDRSYTIQDWLGLHQISRDQALALCRSMRPQQPHQRKSHGQSSHIESNHLQLDMTRCIESLIIPAFVELLGAESNVQEIVAEVEILNLQPSELDLPYTTRSDATGVPSVRLVWNNDPESLMTLAHEMGHAIQMRMCDYEFMPPLVREVCAFMGELATIEATMQQSQDLYQALQQLWSAQNHAYLDVQLDELEQALHGDDAPYNYRQNYPFARIASSRIYAERSAQDNLKLFSESLITAEDHIVHQALRRITLQFFDEN